MKDIFLYKDFSVTTPISFKDVDGRKGIVTGYFADFNSFDSDGDVIKLGAFTKTINEYGPNSRKPRIKHLLDHDPSQPLGVITELKEDTKGLYYESKLGTHALGEDFVKMVDSGLITEHSIGYRTVKFNQLKPWSEAREGDAIRELTELKLWEGSSLRAWGANMNTPLTGMKAEHAIDLYIKRSNAIETFCRTATVTDETFEILLMENKQLTQVIIDLQKNTQPAKAVEPNTSEVIAEIQSFIKTL